MPQTQNRGPGGNFRIWPNSSFLWIVKGSVRFEVSPPPSAILFRYLLSCFPEIDCGNEASNVVRLQCWTANGAIKQLFFRQTFFSWPIFQTQIIRLQKKGKGSREKIFGRIEEKAKILELKETFKKNHNLSGWESACWKHFHQLVDMKIRNFLMEALGEDECASL